MAICDDQFSDLVGKISQLLEEITESNKIMGKLTFILIAWTILLGAIGVIQGVGTFYQLKSSDSAFADTFAQLITIAYFGVGGLMALTWYSFRRLGLLPS